MSRARPTYEPRSIQCRNCGAGVELKDERTRLRVCEHCHAALELSGTEQRVLGMGRPSTVPYRIEIGARLAISGAEYEVIARVCYIEDADPSDQTHEYYLYNPRRRPLWLSDYDGDVSMTSRTRMLPDVSPFSNAAVRTYDGRSWRRVETGVYEVFHVDGALPYVLSVGDRIRYAELVAADDPSEIYEAQETENEIEYGRGRAVSEEQLGRWLGRPLAVRRTVGPAEPNTTLNFIACGVPAGCAVLLYFASTVMPPGGQLVLSEQVSMAELDAEHLSAPFVVPHDDCVVQVRLSADRLMNAWMYARMALVEADGDTVIHVADAEFGLYSGSDYEGRWTEGSSKADLLVRVDDAGTYRLLLNGVSGIGEDPSTRAIHPLTASVRTDAINSYPMRVAAFLLFGVACFAGFLVMATGGLRTSSVGIGVMVLAVVATFAVASVGIYGTSTGWGTPELEHPDGISIRRSSVSGATAPLFFAVYYSPRAHLGGGVHSGK